MTIFSPRSGRLGIEHIFRTGADRCLLYMSNDIRIRQHIFFSTISNSIIKHPKHDNCAHLAPSVVLHQSIVVLISGFF